jgi:dynein heavy chain
VELPDTSNEFSSIDKEVKALVSSLLAAKNAENALTGDPELPVKLHALRTRLDNCEKALANFVDHKKLLFGRFFFMSRADLLDVLSNGNTPHKVIPHMHKISAAIGTLDLTSGQTSEYQGRPSAIAWMSCNGHETVPLHNPLFIDGSVEVYLADIIHQVGTTLRILLQKAIEQGDEALVNLSGAYPCQVLVTANAANLCMHVEKAINQKVTHAEMGVNIAAEDLIAERSHRISSSLSQILGKWRNLLSSTVDLLVGMDSEHGSGVGGDVPPDLSMRLRAQALIVYQAHACDIVELLVQEDVAEADSFTWQSLVKFRWVMHDGNELGDGFVEVYGAPFKYGYEYYGNAHGPVITPLTGRVYVMAAQALHMQMMCAPVGECDDACVHDVFVCADCL